MQNWLMIFSLPLSDPTHTHPLLEVPRSKELTKRQAVGGRGKKTNQVINPKPLSVGCFLLFTHLSFLRCVFVRRLSCCVFFPLLELVTTFFHVTGWGSRALEGLGRLPDSWDAQAWCFHPLSSENVLLNCAWSLVSYEQKRNLQSSGGNSKAVNQSLVFTYSSKYEVCF